MRVSRTECLIPHLPDSVWSVLIDAAQWPTWNPIQPGLEGPIKLGAAGRIAIMVGPWIAWVPIVFVRVEPGRALFWQGGVRRLFHAEHGFELTPTADGTRVAHIERFTGLIPALGWWLLRRLLTPMYKRTNAGLRERVCELSPLRPPPPPADRASDRDQGPAPDHA